MAVADTTKMLDETMIDPVTGEIIDQKEIAQRLLAQAKEQGVSLTGPGACSASSRRTCSRPRWKRS